MKQTKQKIKCVHCKSKNYSKWGKRKTENRGLMQTYKCNDCGKRFTNDDGFYRMRNSEKKITMGIDLYFSNLSSRKVRNHFKRHIEHNVSHITVLDWCRKYTLKVQSYVDKLNPRLSGRMYADETEIDRGKNNDIFWCSVDWDTRFINATLYSPNKQNMKDATEFIRGIKQSKTLPRYIQTDALRLYPRAIKNVFYSNRLPTALHGEKRQLVKHKINNYQKTRKHNVRIETVFMKIKDRVDDFRGLKALWSAPILLAGIVLQHNFIENHTTTREIPAETAGIKLDVGVNRWLGLIKLASNN